MSSPAATALVVRGAATTSVCDRLSAPAHLARVVHRGLDAVYVDDGGACVALLSRTAVAVPCGIHTLLDELPGGDDEAMIGDGRFVLGSLEVTVTRVFDALVTPVEGLPELLPELDVDTDELPAEALELLGRGDAHAVGLLLGRGSGLTPLGDDVLCGWLAARVALGAPTEPVAGEVARLAPARTTTLSATLLACAARGEVIPEFREVLCSRSSLSPLLAVGHTSGLGLALGAYLAGGRAP